MRFRRPGRADVGINIAPLVDVVFLLVIFFAVSTTFLETSGLKLELPASSSTADRQARDLVVLMGAAGELSFEGDVIDTDELRSRLRRALEAMDVGRRVVVLRADTHSEHGEVVKLMDLIRSAGAEGLTVAARASE